MVNKPKQYAKLHKSADNSTLLEELEGAMYSIVDAMENLRGYEVFKDWFDTLDDMMDEMQPMLDEYEAIAAAEYREEMYGLNRQYLRSVL